MSERARYWADQLAAWKRSGLSQAEFCRQRGLNGGTFAWWKRQLQKAVGKPLRPVRVHVQGKRPKRRGPSDDVRTGSVPTRRGRSAKTSGRFVEVRLAGVSSASAYEVVLARGRSIRVPSEFDPQTLSRLIVAVESC